MSESCIFDASAVLAWLHDETGASRIEEWLPQAHISAVNLAEVIGKLVDWGSSTSEIEQILRSLALRILPVEEPTAKQAGLLRTLVRRHGLSLGDRFCLAAAMAHQWPAITTDRAWAKLDLPIPIEVIR